jgi:hypothetical protein
MDVRLAPNGWSKINRRRDDLACLLFYLRFRFGPNHTDPNGFPLSLRMSRARFLPKGRCLGLPEKVSLLQSDRMVAL